MPLVQRNIENGQETVVFRYAALSNWLKWLMLGMLLLYLATNYVLFVNLAAIFAIAMIATAVPFWPAMFEMRRRMRDGEVTVSGNKYSFANPMTYRWPIEKEGDDCE